MMSVGLAETRESDELDVENSSVLPADVVYFVALLCGVIVWTEDTVVDDCVCGGKDEEESESGIKTPGRDSLDVEGEGVADSDSGGEVVGVGVVV